MKMTRQSLISHWYTFLKFLCNCIKYYTWCLSLLINMIPFLRTYDMYQLFLFNSLWCKSVTSWKNLCRRSNDKCLRRNEDWQGTFEKVRAMSCCFFCFVVQKTKLIWAYEKHKNYLNLVGIKSLKGRFQVHNNKTRNLCTNTQNVFYEHPREPFNILISN